MTSVKKQSMLILLIAIVFFIGIQYTLYNQTVLSKGVEVIGTDTFYAFSACRRTSSYWSVV